MLPLRELQRQLAAALFEGENGSIERHIRANGMDAASRLEIYRNNLREGFIRTLALEFPVVQRLVGEDYFRQLALDFLAAHPSRSGNVHHIGAPFPRFLLKRFEHSEYAYLPDVASLEWAYQEVTVAADAPPLDLDTLRTVDPTDYGNVRFAIHPACRLVASQYPIVRIWMSNQPESASDELIDLRSGSDSVLVRRTAEGIELRRLPAEDFALLSALERGEPLGSAFDAAQVAGPALDLTDALRRFVGLHVLVGVRLP